MNSSNQIQPIANENVLTEKEFQQLLEVDSPTVAKLQKLFLVIVTPPEFKGRLSHVSASIATKLL